MEEGQQDRDPTPFLAPQGSPTPTPESPPSWMYSIFEELKRCPRLRNLWEAFSRLPVGHFPIYQWNLCGNCRIISLRRKGQLSYLFIYSFIYIFIYLFIYLFISPQSERSKLGAFYFCPGVLSGYCFVCESGYCN